MKMWYNIFIFIGGVGVDIRSLDSKLLTFGVCFSPVLTAQPHLPKINEGWWAYKEVVHGSFVPGKSLHKTLNLLSLPRSHSFPQSLCPLCESVCGHMHSRSLFQCFESHWIFTILLYFWPWGHLATGNTLLFLWQELCADIVSPADWQQLLFPPNLSSPLVWLVRPIISQDDFFSLFFRSDCFSFFSELRWYYVCVCESVTRVTFVTCVCVCDVCVCVHGMHVYATEVCVSVRVYARVCVWVTVTDVTVTPTDTHVYI